MYFFIPPVGQDYENLMQPTFGELQIVFPLGTGNGDVMNAPLTIRNDPAVEGKETVVLMASLEPRIKASFAPGQDRVTVPIWDNDGKY